MTLKTRHARLNGVTCPFRHHWPRSRKRETEVRFRQRQRKFGRSVRGETRKSNRFGIAVRNCGAASTSRRNTCVKFLCRRFKPQRFAWSFVQLPGHPIQISLRVYRQVRSLGEVLPEQAIGVLVGAPLPRTSRVAEINIDIGLQAKPSMIRELLATIPGQRFVQFRRQLPCLLDESGNHRLRIFTRHPRQHHIARMTFHQGRNVTVL